MKYIRIRMGNLDEHRGTNRECLNRDFDHPFLAETEQLNNKNIKVKVGRFHRLSKSPLAGEA